MRILIQCMNYAPEVTGIGPFTTGLAEFLAGRGHCVVVATTFPHYPHWRVQEPYSRRMFAVEERAGVRVRRTRVVLPRRGSALTRIVYDTSLATGALASGLAVERPDVVLCVSPPIQLGLTGAALARLAGAPLVLLVQDLPLDAALAVNLLRPGLALRAGRRLESIVYRLSRRVVVISDGFQSSLIRRGVDPRKIDVIPNWANVDAIRPVPAEPELRQRLGAGPADTLLVHTGNMGEKQGLDVAIAAAALGRGWLKLALVGDGSERPLLERRIALDGADNARILPLQAADLFPRLLGAADLLLLIQRANVVDGVAPSKLLSYLAAGRPVLAAVHPESEAARIVRESDGGVMVPPENPAALAAAARELGSDPVERARLGGNGRAFVEARFACERILPRLEQALLSAR